MSAKASGLNPQLAILQKYAPGLFLCLVITATAFWARQVPLLSGVSPMLLAVIFGILFRSLLGKFDVAEPGIKVSMRGLLRWAIVLLGSLTTIAQIASIGPMALVIIYTTVAATLAFTLWLARSLQVSTSLGMLLGAGTSICGASAIVAASSNIRSNNEDVAYALAAVTIMGSIGMVTYPLIGQAIGLDAHQYGIWAGASLHEVAQVVAAGFQFGPEAGETAMVAKLARVVALAPVVAVLGYLVTRSTRHADGEGERVKVPFVPWFVVGFVLMVIFNSIVGLPEWLSDAISVLVSFMMAMALAAVGLETDITKLRGKGLQPLLLSVITTIFIAVFSLVAVLTVL